jgi:RNA polymerase sigma factor (sigma-70 family)
MKGRMQTREPQSLVREIDESDERFRRFADRYIDLVYASARRQVWDAHLAEDVTQAVFIILAKKLPGLPADRPLGAWLLQTTAYAAANARRRRAQREFHERRAAEMARDLAQSDPSTESHWDELSPLLDEGVNRLRSGEREALVLRYFEKMSLGEVGAALGITEAAAGKRVSRALEKLRAFFQRRGVSVSGAALATVLAVKTTEAAPAQRHGKSPLSLHASATRSMAIVYAAVR